jgi:hypothetical protein
LNIINPAAKIKAKCLSFVVGKLQRTFNDKYDDTLHSLNPEMPVNGELADKPTGGRVNSTNALRSQVTAKVRETIVVTELQCCSPAFISCTTMLITGVLRKFLLSGSNLYIGNLIITQSQLYKKNKFSFPNCHFGVISFLLICHLWRKKEVKGRK